MPTYCTADDVRDFLGLDSSIYFTDTSVPSLSEVNATIEAVEDFIDRTTGHSWRERSVENETHNVLPTYLPWWGYAVYLNHRKIRSVSSIKVWNGNAYEEWVGTKDDDYYVDADNGIIYFRGLMIFASARSVKISYTYGESEVSADIKFAAKMLVAASLMEREDLWNMIPEGSDRLSVRDKIQTWRDRAMEILDKYKEWQVGRW